MSIFLKFCLSFSVKKWNFSLEIFFLFPLFFLSAYNRQYITFYDDNKKNLRITIRHSDEMVSLQMVTNNNGHQYDMWLRLETIHLVEKDINWYFSIPLFDWYFAINPEEIKYRVEFIGLWTQNVKSWNECIKSFASDAQMITPVSQNHNYHQ